MPVVFSPGEPETRPLDPTATVYTTAQKVADLLDIGPQEAVLMSATADTNAIYITGTDFRNHGFTIGDKVRLYSDADPFGKEDLEISAIGASESGDSAGTGHVKITFTTSPITVSEYEVADNGYVQNQASFTNGKTRGMTKAKVDHVILKMQDRIDNVTHNAWRPYLVSAEYINFDTYKPYRRRYYTDYVGTAPLLFRNVQQMLRIELWQGADYREICGAEARIKFDDVSDLATAGIYISPGNGTVATLAQGTGTDQWRDDFDATTVAQNFADLVNKEDRVNKATVEFSPPFTLEGSTSNVGVHNEFLATANSDYGTGVVKLTSMRQVKAGETCSIVTTNSNIEISQTQTNSTTFTSYDGVGAPTVINVASTTGFVDAGVAIDASGDVFRYTGKTATSFTGCVAVTGTLSAITGAITQESLLVDLQGGSSSGDMARLRDWWLDHEQGIVYFNNSYPFFEWNAIKVAYICGERYLEKAIEDICTKMVAIELLMADDRSVLIPEGTQNVDLTSKIQLYQSEIDRTLPKYIEMVVFN
tara:strand:- start:17942 stop:19543 length:1602 start_codon:yes stop_codon:yes gene_type:complete